ncbi:unnamed protein product [Chrysoparadoxa australica]
MDVALDADDFAEAQRLYEEGENSMKTAALRTLAGFSTAAGDKMDNEPYYEMYRDYWGDDDYAHKFTLAACAGTATPALSPAARKELCLKGAQYQNVWMYVVHEFEDAISDCKSGDITDNDDPDVAAWDEGVAFYTGSLETGTGEADGFMLYSFADKRGKNFDQMLEIDGGLQSKANLRTMQQLKLGRSMILEAYQGNGDCDALRPVVDNIVTLMTIPLVQGVLRYSYLSDPAVNIPVDKTRAELWAFSAAVLPQLDACDPDVAAMVKRNTDIARPTPVADGYVAVKEALESCYETLGISCKDIGDAVDDAGNVIPGLESCSVTPVFAGYVSETDVTEHASIDQDIRDMANALKLGSFTLAEGIYSQGQNSMKSSGLRTVAGFSLAAGTKMADEPYFKMYRDYWRSDTYADDFTRAACGGTGAAANLDEASRSQMCRKGAQYQNVWMYVVHEFEDAIADCNAGTPNDNDDPGVSAWDEGVAFYVGSLEIADAAETTDVKSSGQLLYAVADKRAGEFGTLAAGSGGSQSNVNKEVMRLLDQGRRDLKAANGGDCSGLTAVKNEIVKQMTVPLVQGLLRYAYLADPEAYSAATPEEWAEFWAFSAAVLPQLHTCSTRVASQVRRNADMTSEGATPVPDGFAAVKSAVESCYRTMGITCADVGGMVNGSGAAIAGMEACSDNELRDPEVGSRNNPDEGLESGSSSGSKGGLQGWAIFLIVLLCLGAVGGGTFLYKRKQSVSGSKSEWNLDGVQS